MAKIIYDILDEAFFQKTDYQYKLAMLLSDNNCTYLLYDNKQWLAYRSYELEAQNRELFSLKDELETLKYQDKIFNLTFQAVDIYLLNQQFTFVPKALFEDKLLYSYLTNVTPAPTNEIIKKDDVLKQELYNVFLLKIDLEQFLKQTFPNYQIKHLLTHLVNWYANNFTEKGNKLFLNFHHKNIEIIYFDDNNFVFANNYTYQTANDAAYYLMLVINQFKLNPETVQLYLSGHIDANAELYNTMIRYVRQVNFITPTIELEDNSPFAQYPKHTFLDLK
jgi:hypothetical protein